MNLTTARLAPVLFLVWLIMLSGAEPFARASDGDGPTQVTINDIQVRLSDRGPVVLLAAEGNVIPIFVDHTVAGSIHAALTGQTLPRPLSHDLMHTILESFGGKVVKTVITLKGGTYYGTLTVALQGSEKVFDSRSSDSIALAIHFKAPILVSRDLLNAAGKGVEEPPPQPL
ncbi:MAG: bifunctional nuclease family protein [Nitrospiraceae bacterium]